MALKHSLNGSWIFTDEAGTVQVWRYLSDERVMEGGEHVLLPGLDIGIETITSDETAVGMRIVMVELVAQALNENVGLYTSKPPFSGAQLFGEDTE